MEVENQVSGKNAEAIENNRNLESEDFYFYNQNKEEAKKNIDSSSKDLTDFIDSLIQDIPAPSEEEINAGIAKILERAYPAEPQSKPDKKKKATLKVLFIAALLSIVSVSCLFVVGSSHNISIENGFVAFAKDTIQIVFFGEKDEEYITVDALLTDLELHGYGDILFPQEFTTKSDEYKVSIPEYLTSNLEQVSFNISIDEMSYKFLIYKNSINQQAFDYVDITDAETLLVNDVYIYALNFKNDETSIVMTHNNYQYYIRVEGVPYSEVIETAKTLR